jgi:hypothetical protein
MDAPSSGSWFPVVAGYGLIALTVALVVLFPRTWWARELLRSYGVRPTGPGGQFTRRNHLTAAGLSVVLALALFALALAAQALVDRYPNNSRLNDAGMVYLFTCSILALMAILGALMQLWRAVFWRPCVDSTPDNAHDA